MTDTHLGQLLELTTVEDVWDLHCAKMQEYGFDRLLYGFTRFKTPTSFGDRRDALILSNHDSAYLERYFDEDHFQFGPMERWAETHDGACSWGHIRTRIKAGHLREKEREILETNRDFDVLNGYTISFRNFAHGAFAAIGLAGKPGLKQADLDAQWNMHGAQILLANRAMHLAVMSLPSRNANRLTRRQREVLEWVAQGKTVPEICVLIGRKQATVEKHLRLARESMNARTTAQAVLKASIQNQIFSYSRISDINFTNR